LHTGHALLNGHLHRIQKRELGICSKCKEARETVQHYLIECKGYEDKRHTMWEAVGNSMRDLKMLFGE
ncbi:hypothetical protein J132_10295, partial [Termitomyces sp. J132]